MPALFIGRGIFPGQRGEVQLKKEKRGFFPQS